jgi:hypothetical protein
VTCRTDRRKGQTPGLAVVGDQFLARSGRSGQCPAIGSGSAVPATAVAPRQGLVRASATAQPPAARRGPSSFAAAALGVTASSARARAKVSMPERSSRTQGLAVRLQKRLARR